MILQAIRQWNGKTSPINFECQCSTNYKIIIWLAIVPLVMYANQLCWFERWWTEQEGAASSSHQVTVRSALIFLSIIGENHLIYDANELAQMRFNWLAIMWGMSKSWMHAKLRKAAIFGHDDDEGCGNWLNVLGALWWPAVEQRGMIMGDDSVKVLMLRFRSY